MCAWQKSKNTTTTKQKMKHKTLAGSGDWTRDHFFMVPFNLKYLHCFQHSIFELSSIYMFFSFIQERPTHSLHRINVWENIILNNDFWLGSIVLNHAMFPLPRSLQNKIFFRCVSVLCEQNTFSEVPFINTPNAVSNKVKWFKHGIRTMIWQKISITLTLVDKDDAKKPSCFFNFQTQCSVTFCFCIKYNVPNLQWRIAYSIDVS